MILVEALVVVIDCDREDLLGVFLADDVFVEAAANFSRCGDVPRGNCATAQFRSAIVGQFLFEDRGADLDAFIADVDARASDEFFDLGVAFATE